MKQLCRLFILVLTISISVLSCSPKHEADNCGELACTLDYRTITVSIKNKQGNPVALDDFKVRNLNNQKDITREFSAAEFRMMQNLGIYPLFGDEFTHDYLNKEIRIEFRGFLAGKDIIRSEYKVGADCCHVYFVSGNKELVVE